MIVRLDFHLDEEVTPEIFVQRISDACHLHYAIRENEFITITGPNGEVQMNTRPEFEAEGFRNLVEYFRTKGK